MNRFPPPHGRKLSRTRLRLAFVGLGVLLLSTLGVLSSMAHQRLEEAQREREEMVASRIFDEMEREISAFLDLESDRPPYTSLGRTNPETWAPFVVGYFSGAHPSQTSFARVVVAEGKTSEHQRRMIWALERASETWTSSTAGQSSPVENRNQPPQTLTYEPARELTRNALTEKTPAPQAKDVLLEKQTPPQSEGKPSSDREIIESLNRAPERRKTRSVAPSKAEASDPFSDYSRAY